MRSVVALIVAGAVIGCGARSGLLGANAEESGGVAGTTTGGNAGVGGSSGGSGGAGGSGTGGVGAIGGVGATGGVGGSGGTRACVTRGLEGIAEIDGVTEHDEESPDLVLSSDDGSKATLMFRWKPLAPIDPIGIPPAKLGHLDFAPWAETWPASLGQAWVAQSYGSGSSFALGDAPGDAHAYTFVDDGFTSGTPALRFASSAVPKGGPPDLYLLSVEKTRALFVTRGASNQLVGFEEMMNGTSTFGMVRYGASQALAWSQALCTHTTKITASAVAAGDGYLVASSSDVGLPDACTSSTSVVPRIMLLRFGPNGVFVVWELFTESDVRQVKLLPRPSGYWLVWQKALGAASIEAMALDPEGNQVAPPTTLVPSGATVGPFAATSLGSGLAIAYAVLLDFDVFVDVFAESGIKLFDLTTPVDSPPPYGLLASPNGDRLLLSFAAPNPKGEKRVFVARFCLPPGT